LIAAAPRVLALDLGTVRIGLALSDPLRLTAQPAGKLERRALKRDLAPLLAIVRDNEVGTVVVGHPLLMSGDAGTRAKDAETFVERLRAHVPCPVVLWDERLTSVQANRALLEGDVSRRRRREVVDAAAAALLLQSWLDAQATERQRGSSST
jgi:putative Holliday junction resolvase